MEVPQGKHAWMVKIGEKGQFVIPKEARDIFGFHPGDELLLLGDDERGIAILPKAMVFFSIYRIDKRASMRIYLTL